MIYALYILTALLVIQGVVSLIEGARYFAFIRGSLQKPFSAFAPKAAILAPCKGLDAGLRENLCALFEQDYPQYEIIFVIASGDDPSRSLIEQIISEHPQRAARLVIAGREDNRSEKVNNLLCALGRVSADCDALVFVDSDARIHNQWLRALVSPLVERDVGAVTGYRWYLPGRGGFWSAMLSAWNASIATTLGNHGRNFAWGGATAMLRKTFDCAGVAARWKNAVSDDFALTRAVLGAGLLVKFEPRCLTLSRDDASFASLLEFTTRQITITRVYRPDLWWLGLLTHFFFSAIFFGGLAFAARNFFRAETNLALLSMLGLIYILGSIKGALKLGAAGAVFSERRGEIARLWWMFGVLWPLVSLLFLYNFAASATTRRIIWRGVCYEMRSPDETIVLARAGESVKAKA